MKHTQNNRRGRSRGAGKRSTPSRHVYESNGPDVKVRGTPQQVLDKYLTLARDAQSAGDRVLAESYLQFAEHYFRLLNADGANSARQGQDDLGQQNQQGQDARGNRDNRDNRNRGHHDGRGDDAPVAADGANVPDAEDGKAETEEAVVDAVASEAADEGDAPAKPARAPRGRPKTKAKAKTRTRKPAGDAAATA